MRQSNERNADSGIYARLRSVKMSASDRQRAVDALRRAEGIVDAITWAQQKLASIGQFFLKPSLKH
jgi:hypothetical protein